MLSTVTPGFPAARYHSLMAVPHSPELEVTAWTEDGVIMGLQHRQFPLHGVQFHPESFLTDHGHALAANFLEESGSWGRGLRPESPYRGLGGELNI
jgi:anthranilate/para-aminobenzoate synthase component II